MNTKGEAIKMVLGNMTIMIDITPRVMKLRGMIHIMIMRFNHTHEVPMQIMNHLTLNHTIPVTSIS